ncbi:MAG: hypothetical protein LBQ43_02750, partial [Holosporales bacterium]|nr:hypothetical protein [Holosporales bacterium]
MRYSLLKRVFFITLLINYAHITHAEVDSSVFENISRTFVEASTRFDSEQYFIFNENNNSFKLSSLLVKTFSSSFTGSYNPVGSAYVRYLALNRDLQIARSKYDLNAIDYVS